MYWAHWVEDLQNQLSLPLTLKALNPKPCHYTLKKKAYTLNPKPVSVSFKCVSEGIYEAIKVLSELRVSDESAEG